MRPIVTVQNPLRFPLNEIFGTQSNVRLLRVLATDTEGPLTVADAARRAGLTIPGAQKALRRLVKSGLVRQVGGGKKQQYEICYSDPFGESVRGLFKSEKNRYEKLISHLQKIFEKIPPPPHAAWIQSFPGKPDEALVLGLLHDTRYLAEYMRNLRKQFNRIEKNFDLTIEIVGHTKADIQFLEDEVVMLLYGLSPFQSRNDGSEHAGPSNHRKRELWLKNLSIKVAESIEKDASLITRAREHIDQMLKTDRGLATGDIKEWRDILKTYSVPRLTNFMTSSSERAERLRQSNPFFAILTPEEKSEIANDLEVISDA